MSTPHNEANLGDIAKTVIMPGDPLRAKYIAENFLDNYKLVNSVRGIFAYTGKYKGKELTIMASGMGMPSMGIYSYELYKYYGVENIIRIGSCGSYKPELKLFDIILAENVFSEGNFALTLNNEDCHIVSGNSDVNKFLDRVPKDFNPVSAEMEAFALFYVAKVLNKKSACIMSVVDSKYIKEVATPEERQTGLTNMIKLALDSSLKITD